MEINVDFTYEHSDLNLSPTKVQVLTGEYKDLIFEFNNSGLAEWFENGVYKNKFNFEYALGIVIAIGGKEFDWTNEYINAHGGVDGYYTVKKDYGVIAQDVQKVFPKAIRIRPDGSLAVDYTKLGVLAFAAISELLERIKALEAK
jgi:hypothetical protein